MAIQDCVYVKTGGGKCGSPAMADHKYCYFHFRLRYHMPYTERFQQVVGETRPGVMPTIATFQFPLLDDEAAVQIDFMQLIHGLANGRLHNRQARLLLSALHGASANLRLMNKVVAEGAKNEERMARPPAPKSRLLPPSRQDSGRREPGRLGSGRSRCGARLLS